MLMRDIMSTDGVSHEVASSKLEEVQESMKTGMLLYMVPGLLGITVRAARSDLYDRSRTQNIA